MALISLGDAELSHTSSSSHLVSVPHVSPGALNDQLTSRRAQKQTLQQMHECEKQLSILATAEEEAKKSLVSVIEIKLEGEALVQSVGEADPSTGGAKREKNGGSGSGSGSQAMNVVVVGIIWGSSGQTAASTYCHVLKLMYVLHYHYY